MDKKSVYEVIDSKALDFAALSDEIWDYAASWRRRALW